MLLNPSDLHDYQRECVMFQIINRSSMLWLQMGLGKTPITLTSIVEMMRASLINKVLIVAPLTVVYAVWAREAQKWSHTKDLRFSIVHGNEQKRTRALFVDADIYLTNYENLNWLAATLDHYYLSQDKLLPFEMVVYDEVSKLKNSTSLRMAGGNRDRKDARDEMVKIHFTGWRKIIPHFKYRTGLTGTPAPNGYLDLFGQYLAVDGGDRLGEHVTHYKNSYFASDYNGWAYTPTEIGKQVIEHKISDITKKMDAKDYLDMPDLQIVNRMIDLPPKVRKAYIEVEKDLFTQLDNGTEIELFNRTSISNKCLQFCNGSPYINTETRDYEKLHDCKLNALEDVIEEAGGSPVLCGYVFRPDAERIMHKFKTLKPVNLTTLPKKDLPKTIEKWNSGRIKLAVGHPACLHPSTQVLTERRGWVKIIDVKKSDNIFDGLEFVNHDGCSYSGYKEVIDVFDVIMTPDHKLLINDKWMEAKDVRNFKDVRRKALYQYEGDDSCISQMFTMQGSIQNNSSECSQTQQLKKNLLPTLYPRQISQHDRYKNLANLARVKDKIKRSIRQRLRRSWDRNVRKMGRFHEFLQGYAQRLFRQLDYRTNQCKRRLLQTKLHMGVNVQTTIEQAEQSICNLQRKTNSSSRIDTSNRIQQNNFNKPIEQWNDGRRSSTRCNEFYLREKYRSEKHQTTKCKKEDVYDLINCGPRHQFLIKNDKGEMFISHNSMGHGVDGLQNSCSILVLFGLNWSLELNDQIIGRLWRQGQTRPVSVIRLLCNDTFDLVVADSISRKNDTQEGLKAAVDRYRKGITTNDLEVNFF